MLPLHGIGVLVTRPQHQATPLCRLLEAQGALAHRFPAIEIHPIADRRTLGAHLGPIEDFGLIIFASANAVRFGAALLNEKRELSIAAIGPATARALNQAGYRVSIESNAGIDSEGLLGHPKLNAVANTRVLIVKGAGGRDLLREELTRRGALVSLAEVYRREPCRPSAAELEALDARFDSGAIQVITATSAEIADTLLALASPALRLRFDAAHWLIPGARVAQRLREQGINGGLLQADSAEDHDLVSALMRWRAGESGA